MCAKVVAPLMSMDASGTIGKTLVFAKNKGTNYVRQFVIPSNPRTAAQTGVRSSFAGLVALWKAYQATIHSNFEVYAQSLNLSTFNAFTGFNQKRLSQDKYAANTPAPTEEAPSANVSATSATVNLKYIQVGWTDSVDADAWAVMIYRKLGAAPTGLNSELVAMVPRGTQLWNDGPLAAGTWNYAFRAVHVEGGGTAIGGAVNGVVI
jgi:hypothetical protein